MLSRILGGVGRTLITAGVLVLLFVVYELWGTGLQEAKAQKKLRNEFAAKLATTTTSTTTSTTTTTLPPGVTATTGMRLVPTSLRPANLPLPQEGDPVAEIKIPKIGVTRTVVEGETLDQLKRGPGHYPDTPLPGQAGNAGIAGHRTTYGQPFHNLDKLGNGDKILIKTLQGEFVYQVDRITVVKPNQKEVLFPTKTKDGRLENRLTLTACHPKYSARERLIVSGILVGKPAPMIKGQQEAIEKAIEEAGKGKGANSATIDASLSGADAPNGPVFFWGFVCALIWLATWLVQTLLRRRMRHKAALAGSDPDDPDDPDAPRVPGVPTRGQRLLTWTPYLVGVPLFLVALYVFFENFGRLLPGNY